MDGKNKEVMDSFQASIAARIAKSEANTNKLLTVFQANLNDTKALSVRAIQTMDSLDKTIAKVSVTMDALHPRKP
ncbi:MAG: hypothetical protein GKR94_22235 [Gammaproteobacteria bacterium]|nr:hypothetical protein [Gammaproteobacteria bacterium]